MDPLAHRIAVARGDAPADLVIAGAKVMSVFTGELIEADLAVAGGHVAGIGRYEGAEVFDAKGLILLPGFIDAHMHLESTKLMPDEFARAALPSGTTTVVLDPHEIANVFGIEGVAALLRSAANLPFDCYVMVPSCVPASPFEASGAVVGAAEVTRLLREEPRALGLAEVMDFPAVVRGDEGMLAKIAAAGERRIDGHAPGLSGAGLNAYLAAGPASDHECVGFEEALEKRRLGMWIMIREGSTARNLEALLPLVMRYGPDGCMLCTDDREPDHLLAEGHINDVLRKAVALGCPPHQAVVMATLNTARYHRLHHHGALAPGYLADVVAVEDLERFAPTAVWKAGRLAARAGKAIGVPKATAPDWMRDSMRLRAVSARDFEVRARGKIRVIGVEPGQVVTRSLAVEASVRGDAAVADPSRDLAKVAVVERHHATGRVGVGFLSGFGLARGALASTHAHDAHNVVVVGVEDADMAFAVNRLAELGGGQVAVENGRVLVEMPLPIGGLLSDRPVEEVARMNRDTDRAAAQLGARIPSPFMAMSFLALSVIPELKITDQGLVDVIRFERVPLEVGEG